MPFDPVAALFAELGRLRDLDLIEAELRRRGYARVAGVDEVGRGCLAGPVVAAAVVLPPGCVILGVDDSKRLDPEARTRLDAIIRREAVAWGIGLVSAAEIDTRDILRASLEAMRIAVAALSPRPDALVLDAVSVPGLALPQLPVIHGDALSASVAAASIVAKVHRDRLLDQIASRYPAYGFENHKGYATAEHCEALRAWGPCPEHRLSYHGVVSDFPPADPNRPVAGRAGPRPRSG